MHSLEYIYGQLCKQKPTAKAGDVFCILVKSGPFNLAAAQYLELNPVKAGIVDRAVQHPWSSAKFHITEKEDCIVSKIYLND